MPAFAACAFALGTWVAFGAVALNGPDTSPRLALPGSIWILLVAAVAAFAYVLVRRPTPREAAPLWLPVIALVPWLPIPLPPAAMLWTGPLARGLVLFAITAPLWRRSFRLRVKLRRTTEASAKVVSPADARDEDRTYVGGNDARAKARAYVRGWRLAFAIAAILYFGAAWRLSPVLPSGDEPHYLVIAESLLRDGDLRIENNHASRGYLAYVDGELKPDYLRRGRDREIYSVHAPGLPALLLPAFALAGYPGVVVFLALLSAAGAALAWRAAFEVTNDATAAWIGWAAVALSAPFFFQAFTVFPDAPAAVIVMVVVYALVRDQCLTSQWRLLGIGAALATLPWLHTRYALIAGASAVVVMLRLLRRRGFSPAARGRLLLAFVAIPIVSAIAWLLMFQQIYGTFDPRAPYGGAPEMRLARIPIGLTGLVIDQQFGLLPNAPIYLIALGSIVTLAQRHRRLAAELVAIAVPYVISVAAFHMWWAGLSSPARFLVPVLLPLAIPVAIFWQRHESPTPRAATAMLVITSVAIAAILACAGDGNLLYNTRDGFARWLDWLAPAVNLSYALPSLFQERVSMALVKAAVWIAALGAGWRALRALERRSNVSCLTIGLMAVGAVSLGATGGWLVTGRSGTEPGTSAIAMLGEACGHDRTLLRIAPFSISPSKVRETEIGIRDAGRRPVVPDGPIWTGRDIAPGTYRVWLDSGLNVTGGLTIALGKMESTFKQCTFTEHRPGVTSCVVDLPAGATWLWMTPDAFMRSSVEGLRLQPLSAELIDTCDLRADRAVVTPGGVMFAEKGSVYAESAGLWVIGGKTARLTIQPRGQRTLAVRNGPEANVVRIANSSMQDEYRLMPGELRTVRLSPARGGAVVPLRVSSENGFRPADLQAGNRDLRYLGVWAELR